MTLMMYADLVLLGMLTLLLAIIVALRTIRQVKKRQEDLKKAKMEIEESERRQHLPEQPPDST